MPLLEFQDVSFHDANKIILKNICIDIDQGDFVSIVGPSGSGKSTLLKLCCHLISPTNGNILFKGKRFPSYIPTELRKSISYCFQTPYLFGDTVMENVNFPFFIRNLKPDESQINDLFSRFYMAADDLNKDVKNLSGGEKQRIALIRNLLFRPEVLLLDEVTSALDAENAEIVGSVINTLNNEGVTVLWVTHNPEQTRQYANKLLTIEAGAIKSLEVLHERNK